MPEVIVADRRWHALVRGSGRIVARAAQLGGGAGSVLLTTDRVVRRLNARHRGQDHATNVLTFEAGPGTAGDIVLALGVVRREAGAAGRRASHHLAHLVLHGALHLRGHDHHGAGEARRMEMREAWLLHRMGVPNPWRVGRAVGARGPGVVPGVVPRGGMR
ncbi:MAG: rRNA maturation RNase YbeY [Janthinobacterium lividum]